MDGPCRGRWHLVDNISFGIERILLLGDKRRRAIDNRLLVGTWRAQRGGGIIENRYRSRRGGTKGSGSGPFFFLNDLVFSLGDSEFFLNVQPLTLLAESKRLLLLVELHFSFTIVEGCLDPQS